MTGSPNDDTAAYARHAPMEAGAADAAGAAGAVDAETMQEWRARRPAPR